VEETDRPDLPILFHHAIRTQIAYGVGVALWQLTGLWLISSGRAPLGPTASGQVAVFAIASTTTLVALARWRPGLYVTLSALIGLPALLTIRNAFLADPTLWPSPWTRWGGVALNALGILAPTLAFLGWRRIREAGPSRGGLAR
jgi:hypothetical protein